MHKKRILHIENSTHVTGAFKALIGICSDIKEQYESVIALPKNSECDKIAAAQNIQWTKFPFLELRKSITAIVLYVPFLIINTIRVVRYVTKHRIDIIHANDHFNLVAPLAKAVLGKKVQLVVHVRLLPSTYNHQLYSLFKKVNRRWADKMVAVSYAIQQAYDHPPQMVMIRDRIVLHEKEAPYVPKAGGPLSFVYVSNYIQGKGQNFALDAFLRLAADYPQAELHFYGGIMGLKKNQEYKEALQSKAEVAGVATRVHFHDFAPDTEMSYKNHDISLCFSESESFSLICIESQFYGIPVIASACGGPQEIIEDGRSGLLVENRNVDQMSAAMKKLLDNDALRLAMSAGGKKRVATLLKSDVSFLSLLNGL